MRKAQFSYDILTNRQTIMELEYRMGHPEFIEVRSKFSNFRIDDCSMNHEVIHFEECLVEKYNRDRNYASQSFIFDLKLFDVVSVECLKISMKMFNNKIIIRISN